MTPELQKQIEEWHRLRDQADSSFASIDTAGDALAAFENFSVNLVPALIEAAKGEQWVSVEERLPDLGATVLAYAPKYGQRESKFDLWPSGSLARAVNPEQGFWSWSEPQSNWTAHWNPTHWCKLPSPPVQEVSNDIA